ncbi:cytochrome P450 [Aspergillus venezuelensis]
MLPLALLWSPRKFILSSKKLFWRAHPLRVNVLGQPVYVIQGAANIAATARHRNLSSFTLHKHILKRAFKLPDQAINTYRADNSGRNLTPHAGSIVEPRNRVEFLTTESVHQLLLGPGLAPLSEKFQKDIAERLHALPIDAKSWVTSDNFLRLFQGEVTASMLEALCGKYLTQEQPRFLEDLWALDDNVWKLLFQFPRFLFPDPYARRDRTVEAIKSWHAWARESFDPASTDSNGNDPFWGSRFFRDRQEMFQNMDGFDFDAIASQDLAFLWGVLNNVIVASFWTTLEAFKDPTLLQCIRNEVRCCLLPQPVSVAASGELQQEERAKESENTSHPEINIEKLLQQPFLQAVFAETLRLRVNGFFLWRVSHHDINVRGWLIAKDHYVATSPIPGHMDPDVWSTGENAEHPVDEFYIGRWLRARSPPCSSVTATTQSPPPPNPTTTPNPDLNLEFTTSASKGTFLPFGSGDHYCPGRRFAKVITLLCTALLVETYDVEILSDVKDVGMSMRNFGFGMLGPDRAVSVRMRRRYDL